MMSRSAIAAIIVSSNPQFDTQHRLKVKINVPGAKVKLLPGRFRDEAFIKRHVAYVLTLDAERGEQHVRRNLKALRRTMKELGVDDVDADTELKRIEAAVRCEMWRQVILPGGAP